MINSILKYEQDELDSFIVSDYTSHNYMNILEMPELADSSFFEYYQMQNDEKIEGISQKLYGTPMYWDLLILINNSDPLFDIPYSMETVYSVSEEVANSYLASVGNIDFGEEFIANFHNDILEHYNNYNDFKRVLKIIRPSALQSFLKIARDGEYI